MTARCESGPEVLRWAGPGVDIDIRSTAQVKALLGRLGVEVADTRAWRLRAVQDRPPIAFRHAGGQWLQIGADKEGAADLLSARGGSSRPSVTGCS